MTTPLRIAVAGLGTVGAATLNLLAMSEEALAARNGRPIAIVAVSARDRARARPCALGGIAWHDDPRTLAALPDVDVVVELMGGAEGAARETCEAALGNGKHVVTANKALLAKHGPALARLAEEKGRQLLFEAAVAGGIPVVKTLREALAGNRVTAVRGILNGTCNYILTRMASARLDFHTALQEAQAQGYAEADPSADVDGHDSAHKLALLASLAFGVRPDPARIVLEGIRRLTPLDLVAAADLDCRIKLLGVARRTEDGLEQRVSPCLVPLGTPLASVDDVMNAVQLEGDAVGTLTLEGRGAGGNPTASAVVADLADLARGSTGKPFGFPAASLAVAAPVAPAGSLGSWYIRLNVLDQPGVVADVAAALRDQAISIESLIQRGRSCGESVPVILTTHEVSEAAVRQAMSVIERLPSVQEPPCWLRIEKS